MGKRGPKPLPGNVHLLRGNPSKKPMAELLGDGVARPAVAIPDCPPELSPDARAEWQRITPHLQKLGLVSQIDLAGLAAYCQAWGDYVWARRRIAELDAADPSGERARLRDTPTGFQRVHALMTIADRAAATMRKYIAEFGLSPAARSRVTPGDPQLDLPGVEKPQEGGWDSFK